MRLLGRIAAVLAFLLGAAASPALAQNGQVVGTVTDAEEGGPLPAANVLLVRAGTLSMVDGTATDANGRYRFTSIAPGSYALVVRFVGYQELSVEVTVGAGETRTVDVALQPGGVGLGDVIVTASRQPEKVQDAPASVTVMTPREIEQEQAGISSSAVLRNVAGVDMATTGVDRQEIVLRGFNNAFSSDTYVMTDYRQSAVPSLGVNIFSIMPNSVLDLERVEIVRGPGSALYGAGVDAGVIHFITKDPFTYPGTSVSVGGGERSALLAEFRHAGTFGERFGYKLTGAFGRADDWRLDPDDPHDRAQLDSDADDVQRDYDYEKYNGNLMLQYRFRPGVSLTANGGASGLTGTVLSGIGTVQAEGFGYRYGQLRFQAGNFFAQTYLNVNDAGRSFVYGTGQAVVDNSTELAAQAQYDLGLARGRQRFIFGADLERINPDTEGTILGRNEDVTIDQYGAYLQSTTVLTPQLDLTLAARADYDNIIEEVGLSPRAALVFKVTPQHSVRATFNRAFSNRGTNSNFLDIVAGTLPGTSIRLRGRGAAYGFTFRHDPAYVGNGIQSDLVASSLLPATPGADQPVGLSYNFLYRTVYASLSAVPSEQLAAVLAQQFPGRPFNAQVVDQLKALLSPGTLGQPGPTNVQGFAPGQLVLLNPTTRQVEPISNNLADVEPLKQTTSTTYELGYKGLVNNRFLIAIDGYYTQKRNFVGPPAVETPFVIAPGFTPEAFAAALAAAIEANPQLRGALAQFQITSAQAAAAVVGIARQNPAFPTGATPVAIVQPQENVGAPGELPELLLSYRNFGRIQYYGADVATQFLIDDRWTAFANLSWVSDDFFDNEELDESGTDLAVALNAPTLKVKGGFGYAAPRGLSVNASARYTEGFPVRSGPYVGDVESYYLIDAGLGYDLSRYVGGLRLDVTVQNLLGDRHREFIGAPEIGRLALARITLVR